MFVFPSNIELFGMLFNFLKIGFAFYVCCHVLFKSSFMFVRPSVFVCGSGASLSIMVATVRMWLFKLKLMKFKLN